MNSLSITGRLGRDPELKTTRNDKTVTNFSIANETGWGDNKTTSWFEVAVWGKLAEVADKYLKKGMKVGLVGEVSIRSYEDKEGQERQVVQINATQLDLPPKSDDDGDSRSRSNGNSRDNRSSGNRSSSHGSNSRNDADF